MCHMTEEEEDEYHWGSWEMFQDQKQVVKAMTDLLKYRRWKCVFCLIQQRNNLEDKIWVLISTIDVIDGTWCVPFVIKKIFIQTNENRSILTTCLRLFDPTVLVCILQHFEVNSIYIQLHIFTDIQNIFKVVSLMCLQADLCRHSTQTKKHCSC